MRLWAILLASLVVAGAATAADHRRISAGGVHVLVPAGWRSFEPLQNSVIDDPRTLLVVGTAGIGDNPASVCQIAAYRIPARGAVVVIVGWKDPALSGTSGPTGRAPLRKLVGVAPRIFECFAGRGAVATVRLGRKAFQVNVMVGNRATPARVNEALAVARSFDLSR